MRESSFITLKTGKGFVLLWPENPLSSMRIITVMAAHGLELISGVGDIVLRYKINSTGELAPLLVNALSEEDLNNTKLLVSKSIDPNIDEFSEMMTLQNLKEALGSEWLRDMLDDHRFKSLMQPIVDAESKELHGYEFLFRGYDAVGVEISAPELLSAASEYKMIEELDRLAGMSAIRTAAHHGIPVRMFINLLPSSAVGDDQNLDSWLSLMGELDIDPKTLVLEIVESEAVPDMQKLVDMIEHVRGQGVSIALDDFGSGFNNIDTMMAIRPDYVKLDKSLIDNIISDNDKHGVVANLVTSAKKIGVKVIAEGVEDDVTANVMGVMGVDYFQGHLYGMPEENPIAAAFDTV